MIFLMGDPSSPLNFASPAPCLWRRERSSRWKAGRILSFDDRAERGPGERAPNLDRVRTVCLMQASCESSLD
jgi:hypothetical protein